VTSAPHDPAGTSPLDIRDERPGDVEGIDAVVAAAFRDHPFSQGTEPRIVRGLRDAQALRLSMVAARADTVVGHVAFSPVTLDGHDLGWWGLGPVAVAPAEQRRGIGSALIRSALLRLDGAGVAGCVVLGDPAYYGRFGFAARPGLVYPGPPPDHFMVLPLAGPLSVGTVRYHAAFRPAG
jgi:putative acetyltransferase